MGTTSTSYSTDDKPVGLVDGYSAYGSGSYLDPHQQENDTWFRGFSKTLYTGSYSLINGKPQRD